MGLGCEYLVAINDVDVTAKWKKERRLLRITVDDNEGEDSDSCTLEFDDREPHIEWPPEGASLRLHLGASLETLTDMGTYTLDAPEASGSMNGERLRVRGHTASFVLTGPASPVQTEHSRLWTAASLGDIASTIARAHGLVPRVQPTWQGHTPGEVGFIGDVEQLYESDLAFLRRLAEQVGARVRVKGAKGQRAGVLEVVTAGPLLPTAVITRKDVEDWSCPLGSRIKVNCVTATWNNPKTGNSGSVKAGLTDPRLVLTEVFEDAQSALSACKSRLSDKTRESKQLSLTLTAMHPEICSGTPIALSGFRTEINSVWNVVRATHSADAKRARTTIQAERSG